MEFKRTAERLLMQMAAPQNIKNILHGQIIGISQFLFSFLSAHSSVCQCLDCDNTTSQINLNIIMDF